MCRSFSVVHEHRLQELSQNCARIKTFFKITHRYNTLILKNRHNKLFIMLKRNSINVHCKFGAHQRWELAGRIGDFGNFLNGFAKSPQLIVLNIDWVQYLSWKIVKYCILCEVRMINSTVSPHMWCIKSIKGWFTHPRFVSKIL